MGVRRLGNPLAARSRREGICLAPRPRRWLLAVLALIAGLAPRLPAQAAAGSVDPVAHAKAVIDRTKPWWTRLGYSTKVAQYRVGWMAAQPAGYLLLGSSALTFTAVTGGLPGVVAEVARSTLLALAEEALDSPESTARRIAASQRDASLEAYAEARRIASGFLDSGQLTEGDARAFLELRWGVVRLEVAGALYAATLNRGTARDRAAEAAARDAIRQLGDQFLLTAAGVPPTMRTTEAMLFMNDVRQILERRDVGVMALSAFREYLERLQEVERWRLDELATLRPAPAALARQGGERDGACSDMSRPTRSGELADRPWIPPPSCGVLAATVPEFIAAWNDAMRRRDAGAAARLVLPQLFHSNEYGTRSDYGEVSKGRDRVVAHLSRQLGAQRLDWRPIPSSARLDSGTVAGPADGTASGARGICAWGPGAGWGRSSAEWSCGVDLSQVGSALASIRSSSFNLYLIRTPLGWRLYEVYVH